MGLRIQDSPARAFRKKRISEYIARHGDKDDDFETNITRGARIKLRKQRVKNLRLILENKADTLSPESREKLKSWLESSSEMPRISLGANKMRMIPGSDKKENPSMDGSKRYYKRRGGRRRRPQTFGNLMMVASSEKRTNKPSRLSDIAESKLSPSKAGQMGATRIEEAVDLKHVKQQQQQQYEKMIGTQYQETKSTTDCAESSTMTDFHTQSSGSTITSPLLPKKRQQHATSKYSATSNLSTALLPKQPNSNDPHYHHHRRRISREASVSSHAESSIPLPPSIGFRVSDSTTVAVPKDKRQFNLFEKPWYPPTSFEDMLDRAALYVLDAVHNNPHGMAFAHASDSTTSFFYNIWRHAFTRFLFYGCILFHLLLPFTPANHNPAIEIGIITFYLIVIILEVLSFGFKEFERQRFRATQLVFVVLMWLDLLLCGYREDSKPNFSFIPESCPRPFLLTLPLRPLFFLLASRNLRMVAVTVPSTFKFLSEILITLGVLMICYAIVGTRLFYGLYDEKWRDDARFDSFGLSLISLFILLTTENYPMALYPAYEYSPTIAIIFFWSFLLIGGTLMLSTLLGGVVESYREIISLQALKEHTVECMGVLRAFELLATYGKQEGDDHDEINEHFLLMEIGKRLRPRVPIENIECLANIALFGPFPFSSSSSSSSSSSFSLLKWI